MVNNDSSPTIVVIDTSGGDQTIAEGLRGIDVFEPGTVHITDPVGTEITVEFPAVADGGNYPKRWVVQILIVHDDGSVPDASLVGLK